MPPPPPIGRAFQLFTVQLRNCFPSVLMFRGKRRVWCLLSQLKLETKQLERVVQQYPIREE